MLIEQGSRRRVGQEPHRYATDRGNRRVNIRRADQNHVKRGEFELPHDDFRRSIEARQFVRPIIASARRPFIATVA